MKRFLSLLLVAMLIVSSFATVGFAAGSGSMSANDKTAHRGDTVEVKVTVKSEAGFANFEMFVKVNSPLTITDIYGDGVVANLNTGKVAWANAKNVTSKSFTVAIKVGEGAEIGKSYSVKLENLFVSDEKLEDLSISVDNGSITIECKHDWNEWKETSGATCGKDGKKERSCKICGEKDYGTIPATGNHTWGEWETVTEVSCDADGLQKRECSVCGATEEKVITATGHQFVCDEASWKADAEFHWHECSVCGMKCADHYAAHVPSDYWVVNEKDNTKEELLCEICGHVLDTRAVEGPIDPVPGTGDPTDQLMMIGGMSLLLLLLLAVAVYMIKRKASAK